MSKKVVNFYLGENNYEMVLREKHRYISSIIDEMKAAGFGIGIFKILPDTRFIAGLLEDYAILDKMMLSRENTFTLRRAAFPPYWTVEQSEYRAGMRLFNKNFDPNSVDDDEARKFAGKLRAKHLGTRDRIDNDGQAVFVPLQGRLGVQREGQTMSPVDMIRAIRAHEPDREIFVTLHPGHKYTRADKEALKEALADTKAEKIKEPNSVILRKAKYVATMNSAMGFEALAFGVPTMLFADADYRHVTVNISEYDGDLQSAFQAIHEKGRDYDRYVKWYLDDNMISAQKPDAVSRTFEYLRQLGMEIPE